MSVNNKDSLRVWWGLTGFYPSALIYDNHVFLPKNCRNACKYVLSKQLDVLSVYWAITSYCPGNNCIYTQFLN